MSGEWIKMRTNLWDDPRVSRMVDITDSGEAAIIGALYWLWATADEHSEDGILPGLTMKGIDRKTRIHGFGEAMVSIGWLADHPEGVRIVRFDEHNGASAKRRCSESRRKMSARDADMERTECGNDAEEAQQVCAPRRRRREEEESKPLKSKSRAGDASATRLPADWTPSDVDQDFCRSQRPDLNPEAVSAGFRDYWASVPGVKGRKLDWSATWRNWVRNEKTVKENPRSINSAGRRTPAREDFSKIDYGTGGLL